MLVETKGWEKELLLGELHCAALNFRGEAIASDSSSIACYKVCKLLFVTVMEGGVKYLICENVSRLLMFC